MRPLAIDLFCGLGGWTEGLLAEDYQVVGFDLERHRYPRFRPGRNMDDDLKRPGMPPQMRGMAFNDARHVEFDDSGDWVEYPAQLVIQDVLTLHGRQFKGASLIVASPPCQAYSYRAMPWKRAKALPPPDNSLFEACFRIQREACEAAGRHIPMVVENVCGAQKWVGRARWHFGSFYLWGDIPALMPMPKKAVKVTTMGAGWYPPGHPKHVRWLAFNGHAERAIKNSGGSWFNIAPGQKEKQKEPGRHPLHELAHELAGMKGAGDGWLNDAGQSRSGSKSLVRKAASAMIAKIPFVLARHIAAIYKPAPIPEGER